MKQELTRKQRQQSQGGPPGYRQLEAGSPPRPDGEAEYSNATPEEQAIYNKVVLAGRKVLYDDATHTDVMEMLGAADPATSLGQLVALIVIEIDQRNDMRIPDTVVLPAAMELMDAAAELAQAAGLFTLDADQSEIAVQVLVARLGEVYGIDQEEAQRVLMENVPPQVLAQAGQESAINPMRWKPYREQQAAAEAPAPEEEAV
jgi:hypothetical protein